MSRMADETRDGVQIGGRIVAPMSADGVPVLYANHVQVTFTPEDFTVHLGWYAIPPFSAPPEEEFDIPVRPLAKVGIPLNLVRGFAGLLHKQIEAWEQSFDATLPQHPNPPAFLVESDPSEGSNS